MPASERKHAADVASAVSVCAPEEGFLRRVESTEWRASERRCFLLFVVKVIDC